MYWLSFTAHNTLPLFHNAKQTLKSNYTIWKWFTVYVTIQYCQWIFPCSRDQLNSEVAKLKDQIATLESRLVACIACGSKTVPYVKSATTKIMLELSRAHTLHTEPLDDVVE